MQSNALQNVTSLFYSAVQQQIYSVELKNKEKKLN